ncbi:MAG TPA: peptidoglycan-binding protein, partial [Candidatus Paceibacterota bacterium]
HKQELCRYDSVPVTASVCSPHIKTYIRYGAENDVEDVRKLEIFLNEKQGESLVVDGVYGSEDIAAVKRFQQKYASEVLGVWGLSEPTGYVYRTTLMKINSFYCSASITCPAFTEYNSLTENSVSAEITKTKTLLSELGFYAGAINNTFDAQLNTSLRSFQETFSETMLKPWGLAYGTGYKYKTTNKFLNMLVGCQTPAVELDGRGTFDY